MLPNTDKDHGGHCYHTAYNTTRDQCCDLCGVVGPRVCDEAIRDPADGTCYLISGADGSRKTKKSSECEVLFPPTGPPTPPPPPPVPFEVNFATDLLPLVDDTAGEVRGFAGPPETFDLGVGTSSTVKSWVVTRGRAPAATTGNSGMCAAWLNDSVPVGVDGVAPDQVFVSPVLPGASTVLL